MSPHDLQIITAAFKKHFCPSDHLWLFGSRVDMNQRGGDIDLYVETIEKNSSEALKRKFAFVNELWKGLGEQKIDVVLNPISNESDQALLIYQIAKDTGVQLV